MAEDNIKIRDLIEHAEWCYDFDKSCVTPHFFALCKAIQGYRIYAHKAEGYITMGYSHVILPEWLYWLVLSLPRVPRTEYELCVSVLMNYWEPKLYSGTDLWYYAGVFIHKCIDESAKSSMDRIRSKRIVDFLKSPSSVGEGVITVNDVLKYHDHITGKWEFPDDPKWNRIKERFDNPDDILNNWEFCVPPISPELTNDVRSFKEMYDYYNSQVAEQVGVPVSLLGVPSWWDMVMEITQRQIMIEPKRVKGGI